MRIDEIATAIKLRQRRMQEMIFSVPPGNHEEFVKQQGIWQGLNDALSIIQDAVRKADQDERSS